MSQPDASISALAQLTRRLRNGTLTFGIAFVVLLVLLFTGGLPTRMDGAIAFFVVFSAVGFALIATSVGAVVGSLLLAARRDDAAGSPGTATSSIDWFE